MKKKLLIAIAILMAIVLSACDPVGKATEPFKDVPRSGVVNDERPDIIQNADGFSNVSTKCDHGNRIYVPFHGDANRTAIAVVPNDPTCE